MHGMQANFTHWLEWFPEEVLFPSNNQELRESEVFMVDVGGGYGHDLSAFADKFPSKPIRMILQDLPGVVQEGKEQRRKAGQTLDSRVELSSHDFFQEQPIKGAQIYYMHKIMHDWPDKDCAVILTQIKKAMVPGSRILVNDCILLNHACPLRYVHVPPFSRYFRSLC